MISFYNARPDCLPSRHSSLAELQSILVRLRPLDPA